ncbi:hypothetical protein [Boudabousia marimammalium]|uniref:Uncharacterized protein n=1 Tax=Boudabousia marimammalium TaxID=156892 RepID=A0A1Q5PKI6_9ACTO|nr:hypothetical protein [Boudabousia marimammalium]OKL46691.1 hypothetical protein BM477_06980 [Boudabousia marimammalium]
MSEDRFNSPAFDGANKAGFVLATTYTVDGEDGVVVAITKGGDSKAVVKNHYVVVLTPKRTPEPGLKLKPGFRVLRQRLE